MFKIFIILNSFDICYLKFDIFIRSVAQMARAQRLGR